MQCFHYVDFIRRANSPSASLPTRLLRVCLEGLETSLLMWVDAGVELEYHVGTMIEIPRAALTADEIAK